MLKPWMATNLFSRAVHFGTLKIHFKEEIAVEMAATSIKTEKWAFYPLYRRNRIVAVKISEIPAEIRARWLDPLPSV